MLLNNVNVSQKTIMAKLTKDKRILLAFMQKKKLFHTYLFSMINQQRFHLITELLQLINKFKQTKSIHDYLCSSIR